MLRLWLDPANALTSLGLILGILSIRYAATNQYSVCMITLLLALIVDLIDGPIARMSKRRTETHSRFGSQIDSFTDLITTGLVPAVILMSIGDFEPIYLWGAIAIALASMTRLSYFNLFGLDESGAFRGMPAPGNILAIAMVFLFHGFVNSQSFGLLLYGVVLLCAVLNVAPFRFPKPRPRGIVAIIAFAIFLVFVYIYTIVDKGIS